jgi:hypothetical protein
MGRRERGILDGDIGLARPTRGVGLLGDLCIICWVGVCTGVCVFSFWRFGFGAVSILDQIFLLQVTPSHIRGAVCLLCCVHQIQITQKNKK